MSCIMLQKYSKTSLATSIKQPTCLKRPESVPKVEIKTVKFLNFWTCRVLTRILKIGVKMLSYRESGSFTILFFEDFSKTWSQIKSWE